MQDTATALVTYHWMITIQTPDDRHITRAGTVGAAPGVHTRQSTVTTVLNSCRERFGDNIVVLFFSLEPNQL